MLSDRYSQAIENNGGGASPSVAGPNGGGAPETAAQADWVRNKHTGKKGEFRYF